MGARNKLTATEVNALSKAGRHSDGGGLYLRIKPTGGKSWSYMWKRQGLQREIGLGSYPDVSLKLAREKAMAAREALASGIDPRNALRPPKVRTFVDVAKACLAERNLDQMSPKTKRKWERTAFEHCKDWQNRPIESLNRDDVYRVLAPIWQATPETGRIVRSQLEIIFNYARGRNWMIGDNPAQWKGGLETVLKPVSRKNIVHHPAMDYKALPAFFEELQARDAIAARALEFTILTAARTGEVLNSTIDEFDPDAGLWELSSDRMKSGRNHTVPLCDRTLEIITEMRVAPLSDYIFPGQSTNKPLSNMSMSMLLRRMGYDDITVHGFRSTFRDWVGDCTAFPREVAEAALSHSVGDAVERSYRRRAALDKRRALMQVWADYCTGKLSAEVVALHG